MIPNLISKMSETLQKTLKDAKDRLSKVSKTVGD